MSVHPVSSSVLVICPEWLLGLSHSKRPWQGSLWISQLILVAKWLPGSNIKAPVYVSNTWSWNNPWKYLGVLSASSSSSSGSPSCRCNNLKILEGWYCKPCPHWEQSVWAFQLSCDLALTNQGRRTSKSKTTCHMKAGQRLSLMTFSSDSGNARFRAKLSLKIFI